MNPLFRHCFVSTFWGSTFSTLVYFHFFWRSTGPWTNVSGPALYISDTVMHIARWSMNVVAWTTGRRFVCWDAWLECRPRAFHLFRWHEPAEESCQKQSDSCGVRRWEGEGERRSREGEGGRREVRGWEVSDTTQQIGTTQQTCDYTNI